MNDRRSEGGTLPALDCGLLLLRVGVAGLMLAFARLGPVFSRLRLSRIQHCWPFVDLVAGLGFPFPGAFAVMSALSESVGAVLVAIGWLTRWAALALVIDMSVALFNEGSKGDPIELPALYLVGALTLMITGPGRFAIDGWQRAERRAAMSKVHSPKAASI